MKEYPAIRRLCRWLAKKSSAGPTNAFRNGLVSTQRRRADGELTDDEQDVRTGILAGLITRAATAETNPGRGH